ncbi:MAG: rssA [Cereibacter sp.]|jgi:predicted acylesterase/phospholipase RssA|nr:rssA [Cereibacter sp.]
MGHDLVFLSTKRKQLRSRHESDTDTACFALLACEAGFDPIEERLRANVRATTKAVFEEELAGFLGRLRYDRGNGPAKGYRHRQLSGVATDVETGEDVWFDTATDRIAADHLLAATALLPLFAPVECGGRLLCDAGLSNNLPLDRVLRGRLDAPTLCIAVDLFSACNSRPGTLDQSLTRTQDLVFALQSRRQIETLSLERQLRRAQDHASPPAVLAFMAYRARESEGALKALNFTGSVPAQRAAQGGRDMDRLLQALADAPRNEALALLVAEEGAEHSAEAPVAELVSRP